eukprot:Sspe_Gene.5089::Locus_1676_Transcript_1_1_Confidence_1.000_Length_3330::g.5089::m.5089
MAFLSSVTDTKLRAKYHTESYASPRRQRSMKHQDDDLVLQPVQAGILYQGDFDGKIRCMEVFDGRRPLEKLRMWTAEQDGALAIRNAATGEVLCTFEKKKQVFVTCLLYDRGYMYAGLSDGYIRVYRQTPDATLSIFAEPGKMPITLVGDSCTVGRVKALSPAEVAGFCEGMIITHVNGEEVRSAGEIKKALTGHCDVTVKYLTSSGEPDFEIVAEVKKHTGAVTCMVAVGNEMAVDSFGHPVVGGIFTGGRDWQVFLWSWSNGVFHTVYQYPGQLDANKPRVAPVRNAVRCITYEPFDGKYGGLLYTGNDDCYLRAYDFRQGGERIHPGGFPREAHKQGIRSLVVHREHLFSSGLDGYVKVWDSERGVPITTLFSPMDIELRECPQLSLLKANNYVWSGGVDGVIRVWNASGPLPGRNSWKVTELTEHAGSIVTNMCQVQSGADGYMVWSVSDNRIKLLYSESDAASEEIGYDHVQGFTPKEQALINQIEELRKPHARQRCRDGPRAGHVREDPQHERGEEAEDRRGSVGGCRAGYQGLVLHQAYGMDRGDAAGGAAADPCAHHVREHHEGADHGLLPQAGEVCPGEAGGAQEGAACAEPAGQHHEGAPDHLLAQPAQVRPQGDGTEEEAGPGGDNDAELRQRDPSRVLQQVEPVGLHQAAGGEAGGHCEQPLQELPEGNDDRVLREAHHLPPP